MRKSTWATALVPVGLFCALVADEPDTETLFTAFSMASALLALLWTARGE